MNIIFAGTPDFATAPLAALIAEHNVVAVFTQPDKKAGRGKKLTPPPVKVMAEEHGIAVFQPASLKDQSEHIAALNADIMVVVAYGMILPQAILDIPPHGCINIHASLLPRWRGAAPIQRAIEAGDDKTGISIMHMDAGLDTGAVYLELETSIAESDTSASLHDRLAKLGAQGILGFLSELKANPDIQATEQSEDGVTYANKISKHEADIGWHRSATELHNQIRAFIPWPVCHTRHNGQRLRILSASVIAQAPEQPPGHIVVVKDDAIVVACATHCLAIHTLQKDGGKPLNVKAFLNGYSIQVGDVLTSTNE